MTNFFSKDGKTINIKRCIFFQCENGTSLNNRKYLISFYFYDSVTVTFKFTDEKVRDSYYDMICEHIECFMFPD
jgi:hypothetical protein